MLLEFGEAHMQSSVFLNEQMFCDLEKLKIFLTELYLGPSTDYELTFTLFYLNTINKVFDEIIMRYGIKSVTFTFNIKS